MKELEFIDVDSSNIEKIAYRDNNLYVKYKSGNTYMYEGVTNGVWKGLVKAESKGKFMNSVIKENYKYIKIDK